MSNKPKLLDLFCCAGGAAMGYFRSGFEITGCDIRPQKNYPFKFIQANALEIDLSGYDVIHASPPCQFASELTPTQYKANHLNLIPDIRERLIATGKPYIIENVAGAAKHLHNPLMLCGTMFGLEIWRHRYFENNLGLIFSPSGCNHSANPVLISGRTHRKGETRIDYLKSEKVKAIGIDWMKEREIRQAIPPVFTQYIGLEVLARI